MNKILIYGVLSLLALIFFSPGLFGAIEGKIWPVVRGTEIISLSPVKPDGVLFYGNSEKVRDCQFDRLEWRIGVPGNSVQADLTIIESAKIRPEGSMVFGPWHLNITADWFQLKSFARVYHRCHVGWLTITEFYP